MGKAKRHHRKAEAAGKYSLVVAPENVWPALTGLRGLAALGVLLFHSFLLAGSPGSVPAPLSWLFRIGWSGVDIFFTLSAFLLTMPFVAARAAGEAPPALRNYWRHRAWRVLPAYYVQLVILFALSLAGMKAAGYWQPPGAAGLAVNALFLYDLVPLVGPAVPPWWTLPVEMGFYLVLPAFVPLLTPRRWPWLLAAIVASLAWRWWILSAGFGAVEAAVWANHLPGRLHQFLLGMLAAWVFVRWRLLFQRWTPLQRDMVAGLAAIAFLASPVLALPSLGQLYTGLPSIEPLLFGWHLIAGVLVSLMLVALASGPSRLGRLLSAGWLQVLGLVSYSLYLWHYPVLLALREALGGYGAVKLEFWPFLFHALLFSLLAAAASWWLVERPAQRRSRRDKMPA